MNNLSTPESRCSRAKRVAETEGFEPQELRAGPVQFDQKVADSCGFTGVAIAVRPLSICLVRVEMWAAGGHAPQARSWPNQDDARAAPTPFRLPRGVKSQAEDGFVAQGQRHARNYAAALLHDAERPTRLPAWRSTPKRESQVIRHPRGDCHTEAPAAARRDSPTQSSRPPASGPDAVRAYSGATNNGRPGLTSASRLRSSRAIYPRPLGKYQRACRMVAWMGVWESGLRAGLTRLSHP